MNSRAKKIFIVLIIICSFVAVIGGAYSFFSASVIGNDRQSSMIGDTANLVLSYEDDEYVSASNIEPGWTITKTFKVINKGDVNTTYNINWLNLTNTFINKETLVYSAVSTNDGGTLVETSIPESGNHIPVMQNININVGQTQMYTFTFVYKNADFDQSSDMEKIFEGKFEITSSNFSYAFDFTGDVQEFVVPKDGIYKVELWGAEGGTNYGIGYGAYTSGDIYLTTGEKLYVYVGENPTYTSGSCYITNPNNAFNASLQGSCAGGGGATDIRLIKGTWDNNISLNSRIMVSGGGGGAIYSGKGGDAGGLISYPGEGTGGNNNYSVGTAADQNGTDFGIAIKSTTIGGGGYYGGKGGYGGNASGGSSYISGHIGTVAVAENSFSNPRAVKKVGCLTGNTDIECGIHYSNKMFFNTKMIDGSGHIWTNEVGEIEPMPNYLGGFYENGKGNVGNGYAKISYINSGNLDNYEVDGLVGHYDGIMNTISGHNTNTSSWHDLSIFQNNAIINGSASTSWTNDGLELDGIDDYVQINNTSYNILPSAHEFTLEYVLTIRPSSETYFAIFGLNHHYLTIINNKTFKSMNKNSTASANNWPRSSVMNFSDNSTHTFAETYSDNGNSTFTVQYYYDGFPLSVSSNITAAVAYVQFLRLGIAYDSSAYYAGNLKSIRIYDRALSRIKVYENYINDLMRFDF